MDLTPGLKASAEMIVSEGDTASAMGSGDVPVLATPRLIALSEKATVSAISESLPEDATSVGTSVRIEHLRATGIGGRVTAHAELTQVDGKQLSFTVRAEDGEGRLVGRGEVTRAVVGRESFLSDLD